eukprot:TRINITY_DN9292_c0_g1_i1.p1 TRINITY_DN9292_c0_g1~~TRINITY_DN9292_c0_g1_i1.p1  ORF type:complete len:267 (+),score=37.33 TRINITY_DN9292_c0_g1_i1:21-821(+)
MNCTNRLTLDFLKTYQPSPFKIKKNNLVIPKKYLEVLESLSEDTDFRNLSATESNWKFVRELLVSGYWLDCWYEDGQPTIPTKFFDVDAKENFEEGQFIRLNSLSTKEQTVPLYSLDAVPSMLNNERCSSSMELAKRVGRKINLAVRKWMDFSQGIEWRCFVYDDKLRAICSNDYSISDMKDEEVIKRVQTLFDKIRYNMPCVDCVMDVWLHDYEPSRDLVVEFNSYGFWGNAGVELYDWVEDGAILYGLINDISVRRMNGDAFIS